MEFSADTQHLLVGTASGRLLVFTVAPAGAH
jgi:hypothetical protein